MKASSTSENAFKEETHDVLDVDKPILDIPLSASSSSTSLNTIAMTAPAYYGTQAARAGAPIFRDDDETAPASSIFSATYSNVPVLEMVVHGIPIMRREADKYMNATQILKLAGFSKPRRTKILEREILPGIHEKIQGGYGKYQGTWIPLEVGRHLARKYNVEKLLSAMFDYDSNAQSAPAKPIVYNPFPKPYKKRTASVSKASSSQAPVKQSPPSSPIPVKASKMEPETLSPVSSHDEEALPEDTEDVEDPYEEEESEEELLKSRRSTRTSLRQPPLAPDTLVQDDIALDEPSDEHDPDIQTEAPSRSSALRTGPLNIGHFGEHGIRHKKHFRGILSPHILHMQPLNLNHVERQKEAILTIWQNGRFDDLMNILRNPIIPYMFDINYILDQQGHTSVHFAAAFGKVDVLKQLVKHGADIFMSNRYDHSALIRAVMQNDNHRLQTFPQIVHILSDLVFHLDAADQSVLHHIASKCDSAGGHQAAIYYIYCVAYWLERHGDHRKIQLLLDQQDYHGDTALHIAIRNKAYRVAEILVNLGTHKNIQNQDGETCFDLAGQDSRCKLVLQGRGLNMSDEDTEPSAFDTDISKLSFSEDDEPSDTDEQEIQKREAGFSHEALAPPAPLPTRRKRPAPDAKAKSVIHKMVKSSDRFIEKTIMEPELGVMVFGPKYRELELTSPFQSRLANFHPFSSLLATSPQESTSLDTFEPTLITTPATVPSPCTVTLAHPTPSTLATVPEFRIPSPPKHTLSPEQSPARTIQQRPPPPYLVEQPLDASPRPFYQPTTTLSTPTSSHLVIRLKTSSAVTPASSAPHTTVPSSSSSPQLQAHPLITPPTSTAKGLKRSWMDESKEVTKDV